MVANSFLERHGASPLINFEGQPINGVLEKDSSNKVSPRLRKIKGRSKLEQNPGSGNTSAENREEKSIYFETNRGVPRLFTSTSTPRPGSVGTEPIPFLERG